MHFHWARFAGYASLIATSFIGSAVVAQSQTSPAAPPAGCEKKDSPAGCVGDLGRSIKWHPGHYVRPNAVGLPKGDYGRFEVYDRIKEEPLFRGALIIAPWGMLEPKPGEYDFSQIDKDLNYLKSFPTPKRLMIEVWWQTFGGEIPKTPQNAEDRYVPDYIVDGGGVTVSNYGGYSVRIHDPKWMNRLIALFQALGKRYNSDPYVEQIVITETAAEYADKTFSGAAMTSQFKRLIPAVRAAWPNTSAVLYLNFLESPDATAQVAALCAETGVGIGAPDILPPPPHGPWEDWGSRALRGAGYQRQMPHKDWFGNFGTTDYRGKIPISYSFEVPEMGGKKLLPPALYDYAYDTLKATHIVWGSVEDNPLPEQNWRNGVLPLVRARNGKIHSTCPTAYRGHCISQ